MELYVNLKGILPCGGKIWYIVKVGLLIIKVLNDLKYLYLYIWRKLVKTEISRNSWISKTCTQSISGISKLCTGPFLGSQKRVPDPFNRNGAGTCFWDLRNGSVHSFEIQEMDRVHNFELQEIDWVHVFEILLLRENLSFDQFSPNLHL